MIASPLQDSQRTKLIAVGLYLSKYDSDGLRALGFGTFVESFNVMGYALGAKPASLKNYRDEFDPYFPNRRKGWHKRDLRDYCLQVFEQLKELDFESFTQLVKSFTSVGELNSSAVQAVGAEEELETQFAKRLVTGLAAEKYFEATRTGIPEFKHCSVLNTTQLGCGYDFRLEPGSPGPFLAVEVKGLRGRTGSLSLTSKEYEVAKALKERYFLFLVRDFQKSPSHEIFQNPLSSRLSFSRHRRVVVDISWQTTV